MVDNQPSFKHQDLPRPEASTAASSSLQPSMASNRSPRPASTKRKRGTEDPADGRSSTRGRLSSPNGNPPPPQAIDSQEAPSTSLSFTPISSASMQQPAGPSTAPHAINGATSSQDVATAILSHMNQIPQPQNSYSPTSNHNVDPQVIQGADHPQMSPPLSAPQAAPMTAKPVVGTAEWHKQRKDNHKEVERRRRETINEGINELAKIVPGCDKHNKGSILQRAIQYITQLKDAEQANIEKWTLDKLLTEQAIQELSTNNEKLKTEVERAWRESETWKKACQSAGISRPDAAS